MNETGLRGLSEDEKALLNNIGMWGSSGYPVQKVGSRHWTWGPWRGIKGEPVCFTTKRQAVASFEAFMDVLRDASAGRI